jgi:hypothetical protein
MEGQIKEVSPPPGVCPPLDKRTDGETDQLTDRQPLVPLGGRQMPGGGRNLSGLRDFDSRRALRFGSGA